MSARRRFRSIVILATVVLAVGACAQPLSSDELRELVVQVCAGQPLQGAADYPGPSPRGVVLINVTYPGQEFFSWLPAEWRPGQVASTQLVGCVTSSAETVETCDYGPGGTHDVKRIIPGTSISLRAARTAERVASADLVGGDPPPCPQTIEAPGPLVLQGASTDDQLKAWLEPFVAAEIAPTPGPTAPPAPTIYTGDLAAAVPHAAAGESITVTGPLALVDARKEGGWRPKQPILFAGQMALSTLGLSDGSTIPYLDWLNVKPSEVEVAIGRGATTDLVVVALRVAGAESAAMDWQYLQALTAYGTDESGYRIETVAGYNRHAFESSHGTSYFWVNGDILFRVSCSDEATERAVISPMPPPTVSLEP